MLDAAPSVRNPLLLLSYGQSNAEAHVAGPRPSSPLLEDRRVVALASGMGLRGHLYGADGARRSRRGDFYRDGRRLEEHQVGSVHPLSDHNIENSSILHAAGSVLVGGNLFEKVYVRAAARGGMRLVGRPSPKNRISGIFRLSDGEISPLFEDLLNSAEDLVQIGAQSGEGMTRCYILFIHGEADRSTKFEDYWADFLDMKRRVDAHLAGLGLDVHWLVTQSAGTDHNFGGNDWEVRKGAIHPDVRSVPNLTFLGPLYPYALDDFIHHDAEAKALIGELAATAIREIDRGRPWNGPMPQDWGLLDARSACITVSSDTPLVIDTRHPYDHFGFSLAPRIRNRIVAVDLAGPRQIRIRFEADIAKPIEIDYAFRHRFPDTQVTARPMAFGGGQIREAWGEDSVLLPGKTLHKWLPGFRITVGP
ncbi:hypothetical protein SAMN05444339_11312 [Loktanella atrilutea]|uniref:Sialate O-acetylesterase domain-containing protein n=1 Tax=Loktanella atrilutea TaxID=366533 RepID=A0A1M5EJ73_LOKAT|nr:hypothetical protein [Loktanella atrilutea]SHF79180.1 hypothetical protein SAMN05444339_11312 [Loktanella atrilutea]